MNIVYAAERESIAGVLADYLRAPVAEGDIEVRDNPEETGSFLVRLGPDCFVLLPDGRVAAGNPRFSAERPALGSVPGR